MDGKKLIFIVAIVFVVSTAVYWLRDRFTGIEDDLYKKRQEEPSKRLDMEKSPGDRPSPPALVKPHAIKAPVALPAGGNTFTCPRGVEAFDPSSPLKLVGTFNPGSVLTLGNKDEASGMIHVTFSQPNGQAIHALCRPSDVGR